MKRNLYIVLGFLSLILAIIGIPLPLLPTTPFLILAAFFFSRGSRRFHDWLLDHPVLGPPISDWRRTQSIRRGAKIMATTMMALSWGVLLWHPEVPWSIRIAYGLSAVLGLWFLWTWKGRPNPLHEGWAKIVVPEDLDSHMEMVGQARPNAELAARILRQFPIPKDGSLLIPGAGTGQLLDQIDREVLRGTKLILSDINPAFLETIRARLTRYPELRGTVVLDDLEDSRLKGPFDVVLVILVLEHIDWRRGLQTLIKFQPEKIHLVIQRNSPDQPMLNTQRKLAPSIQKFSETAKANLVEEISIVEWMAAHYYTLAQRVETQVPDGKTMIGLSFTAA